MELLERRVLLAAAVDVPMGPFAADGAGVVVADEAGGGGLSVLGVADPLPVRLYMPEGFSGPLDNSDRVVVSNPGETPVQYRVVLRFERGERDLVLVDETTLEPFETAVIDAASAVVDAGREDEPFAIEVHSSSAVAAVLRHEEIRGVLGEAFFDPATAPDPDLTVWTFPGRPVRELGGGARVTSKFDFLLWQNITELDAEVQVTFFFEDAEPVTISDTTGALRRDGLEVFAIGAVAAAGEPAAVRIVSSVPIVAFMSTHMVVHQAELGGEVVDASHLRELQSGPAQHLLQASAAGAFGTPGAGLTEGLVGAEVFAVGAPAGNTTLSFANAGEQEAEVTLTFTPASGDAVTRTLTVAPGRRATFAIDGDALGLAPTSRDPVLAPVAVTFTSTAPLAVEYAEAESATTPSTRASDRAHVGSVVFHRQFPIFSVRDRNFVTIFNPGDEAATARVVMRDFLGETVFTQELVIEPGRVGTVDPHSPPSFEPLAELFGQRSLTDPTWITPRLSISVEGVDGAPLVVQFLRTGTNGTEFGSGTLLLGTVTPLGGTPV